MQVFRRFRRGFAWLVLILVSCPVASETAPDPARTQFLDAERALAEGDHEAYARLARHLERYPLYPYLRYEELRRRLDSASGAEVDRFLADFRDTAVGDRLYAAWIRELAARERWAEFLAYFRSDTDAELQCHYRRALLTTGAQDAALRDIEDLWLTGKPRPGACEPVFTAAREAGRISTQLVWERAQLAMQQGQLRFADQLAAHLDEADVQRLALWQYAYRDPANALSDARLASDDAFTRKIVLQAMERLVSSHPLDAPAMWERVRERYDFGAPERAQMERRVALALALRHRPEGLERLARLDPSVTDGTIREWRVRTALALGDWSAVLAWIDRLESAERETPRWQYWRARALEAQGNTEEARTIYVQLARMRNYHGFLAADRIGAPYEFNDQPVVVNPRDIDALESLPAMQRAKELYALRRIADARREWLYATRGFNANRFAAAAKLAQRWNWHDRAIAAIANTPHRDDLVLRFPVAYDEIVTRQTRTRDLDPSWAYAVIRQESAFVYDARSSVGAMGLMQLMPTTAEHVARTAKTPYAGAGDLIDPKINIHLGVAYLRAMLDRFSGNAVPTTAAYNAGETRVRSWIPAVAVDADIWAETLPYYETRGYIENVLAYAVVYDYRLGRTPIPLRARMAPIGGPAIPAAANRCGASGNAGMEATC